MKSLLAILGYLGLAEQLVTAIEAAAGAVLANSSAAIPQIRTYVGGKHIGIDVTVTGLP